MGVVQSQHGVVFGCFPERKPNRFNSQKHGEPLGDSAVGWGNPTQPGREAGMFA